MVQTPYPTNQLGRAANRAKRELLFRLPALRGLADRSFEKRRNLHVGDLPALQDNHRQLVADIEDSGVGVTSLDALEIPGVDTVKTVLDQMVAGLSTRPAVSSTVRPSREELLADPTVWRLGLDERLLDLVENYLGMPARYYGADVRREVADGCPPHGLRRWHRDNEDHRMLKMLVWLNDVDTDGGPFAYMPRRLSEQAAADLRYVGGFVTDEKISQVIPRHEWRLATGMKWTAVLPDTARVFHRAAPPQARDRYSVTFTWTTRRPITTHGREGFTAEQRRRIQDGLSDRQLACLPADLAGHRERGRP